MNYFRFVVLSLLFFSFSLPAQSRRVEEYLRRGPELSPRLLETQDSIPDGSLDGIPRPILEEAVLLNYSRWSLQAENKRYLLQVFEVLGAQAAYGLFTRTQQFAPANAERPPLAVDALQIDGVLHFWRGHFFLKLNAAERSTEDGLLGIANRVIELIDEANLYPMPVVQLPRPDLIRESIRFYLGPESLAENEEFPAPLRQELGFEDYAEVAMGRYGASGLPLFLIGYPTASLAESYFARIQNVLHSYFSTDGVFVKRSGLLISLFPGPEEQARVLLDRVKYTASVRWLYEKDTTLEDAERQRGEVVTFLGVVRSSILFTGAFIVFVLGIGVLAGLLRYWLMLRVPAMQHHDEMIRLDLDRSPSKVP